VSHVAAAVVGQIVPGVQAVESIAWQFGSLKGKEKQDAVVELVRQSLAATEGLTAKTWPTISTSSTRREPSSTRSSRCTSHRAQIRRRRLNVPGRLVVLIRVGPQSRWTVAAAALSASEAQTVVDGLVASNAGARIVVANVVRSFTTTIAFAEDGAPWLIHDAVRSGRTARHAAEFLPIM
jgi:hypothetical protein